MKPVAVAILNWNGKSLMQRFLPSVCRNTSVELADVIVIDNGSTDGSIDFLAREFPSVQIIRLPENYGFAEGYCRGLEHIDHRYVVLLNSDVETPAGWLEPLYEYCEEHPDVAACQPKIKAFCQPSMFEYAGAAGGYLDKFGYPFCRGRMFDTVEPDRGQYNEISDIFWASGAALFIRREDYFAAGGLDPLFFAHMEEVDLCWRVHLLNKRIVYVPQSEVFHLGGATLASDNPRKTYLNFRNSLLLLYKNLPRSASRSLLFKRQLLDTVALIRFCLTGKAAHAKAIWAAHMDFRKQCVRYTRLPDRNLLADFPEADRNVTVDYFLRGKKYF